MFSLRECIADAAKKGIAIGHFNISDLVTLHAIFEAAREAGVPVIIGTSEGERAFVGVRQAAALVQSLRTEHQFPIFLNADHTHSFEKAKEAFDAGYDAILFDGGKLPLEENIRVTRQVVEYVKGKNPDALVEGELGYIGSSSEVLTEFPKGAALTPEELTSPEQAVRFAKETGVDLFAPAVGNIHGIVLPPGSTQAQDPPLDIGRIRAIAEATGIPLVLHGASGNTDEDIKNAIRAGVRVVHINTEIRRAWRRGLESELQAHQDEVAPYKLEAQAADAVREVVGRYLSLFTNR